MDFGGTDQGKILIFKTFIHSWLCYECIKVMYVFGLQPKIRSGISTWSDNLGFMLQYFNIKQKEEQRKTKATDLLAIFFEKTITPVTLKKIILGVSRNSFTQKIQRYFWLHYHG